MKMVVVEEAIDIFLFSQGGDRWNLAKYKKYERALCPTSVVDKGRGSVESYIRRVFPSF